MEVKNKWFSTQVDRDFETGRYGDGIRLYSDLNNYIIIKGVSFTENCLIVKDYADNTIKLTDEPDHQMFETFHWKWKAWDNKYGKYDEDRTDYEPYCHKNRQTLAMELGLLNKTQELYLDSNFKNQPKQSDILTNNE
ncbi:hypothetical protein CPAV1605_735 [seawater metagenome]|uniref:Uncharacterized protein n=1 Tax=seawater metagenome TaxID=1561972 RepID=A0A5E8CMB5_9ZZZZ